MATRMLVDATHDEETRVVVVKGNRLEEFDFETSTKKQLKGNIYLAKVTRVEPSLQAAFVDYGGNRHGFLAFNEIHPDYYQIPIEDRDRLLEAERELEQEAMEAAEQAALRRLKRRAAKAWDWVNWGPVPEAEGETATDETLATGVDDEDVTAGDFDGEPATDQASIAAVIEEAIEHAMVSDLPDEQEDSQDDIQTSDSDNADSDGDVDAGNDGDEVDAIIQTVEDDQSVEDMGGEDIVGDDDLADDEDDLNGDDGEDDVVLDIARIRERARRRLLAERRYKIQEVIKRRQVLLIQVVKEERGNKGAALTTYLSLAGRYCVLMPNTARGGGISRKIVNATMRRKLKGIANSLDVQDGMGLIIRTAGMNRNKAEIKRDYEYLLRQWDTIREETLHSKAPTLINEEASLIKRAIRDLYTREVDEILVEGDQGYRTAKNFMKMLMPSHAKKVQQYRDRIPAFHRYQVEQQLDAMHKPEVELRSGGYIVLAQTEALVAIDVNSGKSTKERSIEETALKTNLEAAEEVARQVRLRDLAGLVVIDFIDMEEPSNNRAVERRLKECLKNDRARIQVGRISSFGLLEMSRQRLRPSLFEASTQICPHCEGSGSIRSKESSALQILRHVEEEGLRDRSCRVTIHCQQEVALYLLNNKRAELHVLEDRYGLHIVIEGEEDMYNGQFRMDRETRPADQPSPLRDLDLPVVNNDDDNEEESLEEEEKSDSREPRRRRRRRRSRRNDDDAVNDEISKDEDDDDEDERGDADDRQDDEDGDDERSRRRRRRGRRGGRRRRRRGEDDDSVDSEDTSSEDNEDDSESTKSESEMEDNADESEEGGDKRRRRRRNQRGRGRNRRQRDDEKHGNDKAENAESGDTPDSETASVSNNAAVDTSSIPEEETADSMREAILGSTSKTNAPVVQEVPIRTDETATDNSPAESVAKETAAPVETVAEPAESTKESAEPAPVSTVAPEAKPSMTVVEENKPTKKGWWRRPFG